MRIANCLADFAAFEEIQEPKRYDPQSDGKPRPLCEACNKELRSGGLCSDCLKLASNVVRQAGMKLLK